MANKHIASLEVYYDPKEGTITTSIKGAKETPLKVVVEPLGILVLELIELVEKNPEVKLSGLEEKEVNHV